MDDLIKKTVQMIVDEIVNQSYTHTVYRESYRKTEELLNNIENLNIEEDIQAAALNNTLFNLQEDPYFNIILLLYLEHKPIEKIAKIYNTDTNTITRNKVRLIEKISINLFPDEVINEMLYG